RLLLHVPAGLRVAEAIDEIPQVHLGDGLVRLVDGGDSGLGAELSRDRQSEIRGHAAASDEGLAIGDVLSPETVLRKTIVGGYRPLQVRWHVRAPDQARV